MAGQVVRLNNDWPSTRDAATTISLAFSDDPLIKWIRPAQGSASGVRPWGELDTESLDFQHRRVQRMNEEFVVLGLKSEEQIVEGAKKGGNVVVGEVSGASADDGAANHDAIAMLEPPQEGGFSLRRLYIDLKYWLLDMIRPCRDPGMDMKRFNIMMHAHNTGLEDIRRQLHPRKPWYLEVIAVRPLSHGKGLGRQMMRGIVGLAGDAPIVLECTDKSTVGFYQKFGFGVVQEMVLKDLERPEDDMVCWWMVRE